MGDKGRQGGRRTHHPTKGNKQGHNGRQDLRKAETPSNTGTHVGKQLAKIGDKGRQDLGKAATPSNTGTHVARQGIRPHLRKASTPSTTATHVRRQWDTMGDKERRGKTRGDKTSGRRKYHPTKGDKKEDNARQDLRKADTPSNKRKQEGRQWRNKTSKRRAHHPTHARMWETRGDGNADRHRHTLGRRTHHPTQEHVCGETMRRQDLGKANTFQHRNTSATMGDNGTKGETRGDKTSGRRTHHPTQAHICEETRGDKTSGRRTHHPTQAHICEETMGDKGRQDLGKADTPFHKGTHVGRQWETRRDKRGDKTSGRRTHHPTPRRTP